MHAKRLTHVLIILALTIVALSGTSASAADGVSSGQWNTVLSKTADADVDQAAVAKVVGSYFGYYYLGFENLEISDEIWKYIADTDETHLYLGALQYGINWRKADNTGIADSKVEAVEIKYAKQNDLDNSIDARVLVTVGFRYLDDKWNVRSNVQGLWEIGLKEVDGTLKIVALDSQASDYQYAKILTAQNLKKNRGIAADVTATSVLEGTTGNSAYTKSNAIDDAYVVINAGIENWQVKKDPKAQGGAIAPEASQKAASEAVTPSGGVGVASVSIEYDAPSAGWFGYKKGASPNTGIFHNMEELGPGNWDCTNFISQCIWVGYHGPNGNDWTTSAGMAACRDLAYANFRQVTGSNAWWGASWKDATPRVAAGRWMRVNELWAYTSQTSPGPQATKSGPYVPSSCNTYVSRGSVLQFSYATGDVTWQHTVVVVDPYPTSTQVKNTGSIYVAQHSNNWNYRQLSELLRSNSYNAVRVLIFNSGSFNS